MPLPKKKKSLSIIAASMNRSDRARDAVDNWLLCDRIDRIIIVDWSSSPPLELAFHPKVVLLRVDSEPFFNFGLAYNLAATIVEGGEVVVMGVDYRLSADFFDALPFEEGAYWSGDWQKATNCNDRCLNGFCKVDLQDFRRVGGFHEGMQGWGGEDGDLYNRLGAAGLRRNTIHPGAGLTHLEHDDTLRRANAPEPLLGGGRSQTRNMQTTRDNPWGAHRKPQQWTTNAVGNFVRHQPYGSQHPA